LAALNGPQMAGHHTGLVCSKLSDKGFEHGTAFYVHVECTSKDICERLRQYLSEPHVEHPLKNKIHQLRKERRWTLTHLASLSGIPYNTIWRMEKGSGTAVTQAYKVAAAFQLTVYDVWSIPPSGTIPLTDEVDVFSVTELRLKRGWRLRELAELSRVSTTTLFAIEKGQIPKIESAFRIAAALGVSVYQIWKPQKARRQY
jgi:DNA-binding XRE family transcriptional regulator